MEKFTKGSWRYESATGEVYGGSDDILICDVLPDGSINYERNGHLIAASPDMYEEIKRDIQWLKRVRDMFIIGSDMFRSCSLRIESKEKLLAKARGEHDN